MSKAPIQIKVVLLGDSGVGKSSIVVRFVADNFKSDPEATLGASYMGKSLQVGDKTIKFNIWDTAGQERYHSLAKMYYRDANAAIMVYDITKRGSYEGLKKWHRELTESGPKEMAVVVAGNKEDLVESEAVSPDEVSTWAKSIGAVFKKTSAKTNFGVEQIFKELAFKLFPDEQEVIPVRRDTVTVKDRSKSISRKKKKCC
jgi:small GTP-binding protein